MRRLSLKFLALLVFSPIVSGGKVQKDGLAVPEDRKVHLGEVKAIFDRSYSAYEKYAFGKDDLAPLSKSFVNSRNGWGATIIDSLATLHIMGFEDRFEKAIGFASEIDFSRSQTADTVRAKELGDKLVFAFVEDNAIPFGHMSFTTNTPIKQTSNIAEAGTLILEWATLSKYTGNDTYRTLAEKAFRHVATNPAPLPGLAPQGIDPSSGKPVGGYVTWGGGSDSYFEYLIKWARYNNTADNLYADTWATAVSSSIQTLLQESSNGGHLYLADYDAQSANKVKHVGSHLACFYPGNWLLGGKLLNNDTLVNLALSLNEACWNTYSSTLTGIGPETFAYALDEAFEGSPASPEELAFFQEHGFHPTSPTYVLRPEVLESNFYAYRVTGDNKYLDRAASAVKSFQKYLSTGDAYSGIADVNKDDSARYDDMESFWFAEVLKYLYLTFDDPQRFSLDDYVFNTEAQLFRLPEAKATYGSGRTVTSNEPFKPLSGILPKVSPLPQLSAGGLVDKMLG